MIPQNTTIITKEMKKQLDVEQIVIQKELEKYNGWLYELQFQLVDIMGKLKFLTRK
jgi:hypothetical protein